MNMRFAKRVVPAVLAALAAIGVSTPPASAALSDCSELRFCIFENSDGSGSYGKFAYGSEDLAKTFDGKLNDRVSAVWNRTASSWCLYEHAKYGGRKFLVPAGSKYVLGAGTRNFDNITSSLRPSGC